MPGVFDNIPIFMQNEPFSSSASSPNPFNPPAPIPQPFPGDSATAPAGAEGAAPTASDQAAAHLAGLLKAHSRGANWFFWIVGLSLVNAVLISFGSDRVLAIGLNATMIMDYGIKDEISKSAAHAAGLHVVQGVFDLVVLGFYAFCGLMAMRGKSWAFYLGMTAFALDTVLSAIGMDVIGGLIHAWALFTMWQGVKALGQLNALRRAAQTPASPWAA